MLFKQVIGHTEIKKKLIRTIREEHVSHAQMFLGPEGCGNLPLAMAYAQYLSCSDKKEDDSCGVCPSCNKYQKLIHPDLHFVFPVPNIASKTTISADVMDKWRDFVLQSPYFNTNQWYRYVGAENKQGMIHKEEGKEIIKILNLKTYESEFKVMLIWRPETLNHFAANTILKILEEPPEKTLFLLVSESTEGILPTILSRTQIIKIPGIDNESMKKVLAAKVNGGKINIDNIVHLSNGNMIKALEQLETDEDTSFNFDRFVELMRLCYGVKIIELSEWVDEIATIGRERQKSFLLFALRLIRENFMLNFRQNNLVFLSDKEMEWSAKFSPFINESNIEAIAEELNKAHYHIESNAYNKLVFMDLALKLVSLLKNKT
jgi:DNA polymerase-3 subunit delta'